MNNIVSRTVSVRGNTDERSDDPSCKRTRRISSVRSQAWTSRSFTIFGGAEQFKLTGSIQCINSISRSLFNQRLLEALSPSIKTRFNTKLSHIDFRSNRAWGISVQVNVQPGQEAEDSRAESSKDARRINVDEVDEHGTPFDLIIGCDGGWSKVRNEMTRVERHVSDIVPLVCGLIEMSRIDFSQSYIQHAYIELHMPADPLKPGGHAMDPNHLHIWPQHKFMLIGLPNKVSRVSTPFLTFFPTFFPTRQRCR